MDATSKAIATASSNQEKARGWLTLTQQAQQLAEHMRQIFPDTTIQGDKISPKEAQVISERASLYGVRVGFCEPSGSWFSDNQGYVKYLELWLDGPQADEATWMGPLDHGAFCGDSEGDPEEARAVIEKNKQFLTKFPNSKFAPDAQKEIAESKQYLEALEKQNKK